VALVVLESVPLHPRNNNKKRLHIGDMAVGIFAVLFSKLNADERFVSRSVCTRFGWAYVDFGSE
jgi:hypothetical protein